MIAALEWVPEGRANPIPSKYEYSRAEQEFMSRVIAQHEDNNNDDVATANGKEVGNTDTNKNDNDGEWQDMSDEDEDTAGDNEDKKKKVELPKVDPSSLPSDLNMDDYSDDDDNDNNGEEKMGDLLGIGKVCIKMCLCMSCMICMRHAYYDLYDVCTESSTLNSN